MRKYILLILGSLQLITIALKAQTQCGSIFDPQLIQSLDPNRYNRYIQLEQFTANYIASLNEGNNESLITPNSTIIVPVVVHVLHNGEPVGVGNNISDAQVQSQIDVLNEDFRRLNADRVNTPAAFAGVAADPNIEFRLACIDPNGNATNGIHRVQTNVNAFTYQTNANGSVNEQATGIKFTAQGGTDAWPTDRYLNIWVCNIAPFGNGAQLLGYAQFPFDFATSPNTDGVVILNTVFGRVGNLRFQYDEGRTTTHEIGHWLNLFHIWGDATCGDDHCNDTPQQFAANQSNCPGFPHFSNCPNNGANGDMFMNYMDYTVDGCKNIYTQDQTNRARAIFAQGGPRAAFINNYFRINTPANTSFCNNTVLTLTNLSCLPVIWSIVSGSANITNPANDHATINATGTGSIVVRATAGGYFDEITLNGYNTAPSDNTLIPWYSTEGYSNWLQDINCLKTYDFPGMYSGSITLNDLVATSFTWTYVSKYPSTATVNISYSDPRYAVVTVKPSGARVTYRLTTSNICGSYSHDYTFVANGICGIESLNSESEFDFSIAPNPTQENLTISAKNGNVKNYNQNPIYGIKIIDVTGVLRSSYEYKSGIYSTKISIADLNTGLYMISVFDGQQWHAKQLVVQK
jgi:hypothetical protein